MVPKNFGSKKIESKKILGPKKQFTAKQNMSSALLALAVCKLFYVKLPSNVVFHQMSPSMKCRLTSKVVFHQKLSSIKGRLPSKVILHQRSSSIKGRLSSKVVFHQRLSSIEGCLPSKIVFYRRSASFFCHFHFWGLVLSELSSAFRYLCFRVDLPQ